MPITEYNIESYQGETEINLTANIKEAVNKREYFFSNETGDAEIIVYQIFPGVEVAYISVHMDDFDFKITENGIRDTYVGFHYCREGRIEQEVDNEFFYLLPGDCSVTIRDKRKKKFKLPLKHYHGISVSIDTSAICNNFSQLLKICDINPIDVVTQICGDNHSAILRSEDAVGRIFSDFYTVHEEQRLDYLKIKIQELLFVVKHMKISELSFEETTVSRSQVEFVRQVAEYITDNINVKITINDLTMQYGVSDTYLQKSFKCVYGMPVISFIRAQKMQCAAQVLIHSNRSVDDIAYEFGYDNESKFSAAFKKIIGDSPSMYRKEHSKVKIV